MARLSVDLNRDGLHEIAVPSSFETDGPFEVLLRNHGEAVHVHLNIDEELSTVANLAESNHYVEPHSHRSVRIETRPTNTAVTGRLKVVTAYGAESSYVSTTVSPPGTVTKHVEVDEQLAKPQRDEPTPPTSRERLGAVVSGNMSPRVAGISTLGICGVLVVAAVVENTALFVGSLVVIVGLFSVLAISRRAMTE